MGIVSFGQLAVDPMSWKGWGFRSTWNGCYTAKNPEIVQCPPKPEGNSSSCEFLTQNLELKQEDSLFLFTGVLYRRFFFSTLLFTWDRLFRIVWSSLNILFFLLTVACQSVGQRRNLASYEFDVFIVMEDALTCVNSLYFCWMRTFDWPPHDRIPPNIPRREAARLENQGLDCWGVNCLFHVVQHSVDPMMALFFFFIVLQGLQVMSKNPTA